MKSLYLIILSWITYSYASTAPVNLLDEKPGSAYTHITAYIHTPGLNFREDETDPARLKILCGVGIHRIGDSHSTGNPKWIQISSPGLRLITFDCPEGNSEFMSRKTRGKQWKLEFLDSNESPTTEKATYYHLTDEKGLQYRIYADAGENHVIGHPVFKITKDGKKHLFDESGFEIILDEQGFIYQFKDYRNIIFISYPDENTRVYDKYSLEQLEPEKKDGHYILLKGSEPVETIRLYHPEPDERRYMVSEEYRNGQLKNKTSWSRGDNPFVFTFRVEESGQVIPLQDDHYYNNENGILTMHRKKWKDGGATQYERIAVYDRKNGYKDTYVREVDKDGETINGYEYLEDLESGDFTQLHVLNVNADGNWFRKTFDDVGRVTMEWTPIGEVIEAEKPKDPDVAELLELFPEASEESAAKHQKMRWIPESPADDLEKAKEVGQGVYYSYAPHFAEDKVAEDDQRPRTVTRWKQGQIIKKEWFAYGSRENGGRYELYEWTEDPDSEFGADHNSRLNKEFLTETHPVAPGKLLSISHPDGTMEYFYYARGRFNRETNLFTEAEVGKDLRTISTRGTMSEGSWVAGTTSRTGIENATGKNLFQSNQTLQENGTWEKK